MPSLRAPGSGARACHVDVGASAVAELGDVPRGAVRHRHLRELHVAGPGHGGLGGAAVDDDAIDLASSGNAGARSSAGEPPRLLARPSRSSASRRRA